MTHRESPIRFDQVNSGCVAIWRTTVLLTVFAALLVACGTAAEPATVAFDPALIAVGGDLYEASCASCHGSDLRGTAQGPSHLSEVYEPNHHGDAAFTLAVLQGSRAHHWNFGDMPAIDGLTAEDVEAIIAFVRDRQQSEGFEPYP